MTRDRLLTELARRWRIAVAEVGFVPTSMGELERMLATLLDEMAALLAAEPFDPAPAAALGARLVRANLTDPRVLPRTAEILGPLATLGPAHGARLLPLLGEFSRGYTAELLTNRARSQELLHTAMAEARRAAEVRFRAVFDNAAVAIAIGDLGGRIVDVNPALAAMLGRPVERLRGQPMPELVHPADRPALRSRGYDELLAAGDGTMRVELRYIQADGEIGWAKWAFTLVPASGRQAPYLLLVGEDTTQQRALRRELERQAGQDPLTGLPNRRHLVETLTTLAATAGPEDQVGVGFIDLDGFKAVNDTYGHGVGDRLLAAVADRLAARAGGAVLTRVGGDEFVMLLPPPCDAARIAAVAEAMLATLAKPIAVDDHRLTISACIGAIVTPVVGMDAEQLLDAADAGLYRAKAAGRNRWVLHSLDVTADTGEAVSD